MGEQTKEACLSGWVFPCWPSHLLPRAIVNVRTKFNDPPSSSSSASSWAVFCRFCFLRYAGWSPTPLMECHSPLRLHGHDRAISLLSNSQVRATAVGGAYHVRG